MYFIYTNDDTLWIRCYTEGYYVDLDQLSKYINDKSSVLGVSAYGYRASNYSIRIYYI